MSGKTVLKTEKFSVVFICINAFSLYCDVFINVENRLHVWIEKIKEK